MRATPSGPAPAARVVALGASNLTVGLGQVLRGAQELLGGPLEFLGALGRGRSFGADSWFLARRLPGIDGCGLWAALARRPGTSTFALLTDVGNDLVFGAEPATILEWVERALDRLLELQARTVLTALPLENLRRLPGWQLELWRRLLFPLHQVERATLLARAKELDQGLRRVARERALSLVVPRAEWYAADPIHVRRARRAEAWREILAPWGSQAPARGTPLVRGSLPSEWRLVPERRWILGRPGGREQPCARLADGTTVALY